MRSSPIAGMSLPISLLNIAIFVSEADEYAGGGAKAMAAVDDVLLLKNEQEDGAEGGEE